MVRFCDDPKKYPQTDLQTPKIFIFLKPPKYIEIQTFEQKNGPSLRMYENIRVPPPPGVGLQSNDFIFFKKSMGNYLMGHMASYTCMFLL